MTYKDYILMGLIAVIAIVDVYLFIRIVRKGGE